MLCDKIYNLTARVGILKVQFVNQNRKMKFLVHARGIFKSINKNSSSYTRKNKAKVEVM